eukprot:176701_1
MQRFVLILDGSIANGTTPEWVENLYIEHLPYSLHLNIALFTNEWLEMNTFQSKIKSICNNNNNNNDNPPNEYDLSQKLHSLSIHTIDTIDTTDCTTNRDASLAFTTFASYIHTACAQLKPFLNTNSNNTHFVLELIWLFPSFGHTPYDTNLHNALMALCGAFQRFIKYNHGHVHIIVARNHNAMDTDLCDDIDLSLRDVQAWNTILEPQHCTLWKRKGLDCQTWIEIIKPHRLNAVQLHIQHTDTPHHMMDIDGMESGNSFRFDFDVIPTFLYSKDSQSFVHNHAKHQVLWRNWNGCYEWNVMKVINVIDKASFPSHLLLSDMKYMMHNTQTEPMLMILNALNDSAKILNSYWCNDDGRMTAWIVQFMNHTHITPYYHTQMKHDAFMSEEQWWNLYVNDDDDQKEINETESNVCCNTNNNRYFVYPVFIENKMRLIAHRIMHEHHPIRTNILNLTYKYTSGMDIAWTKDDVDESVIDLTYFRFKDTNNGQWIERQADRCLSMTLSNDAQAYNRYLLAQYNEYVDKNKVSVPPTPSIDTSTNTNTAMTSSSSLLSSSRSKLGLASVQRKRKRKHKKSLSNRGLLALRNAAKQSKCIQSAHVTRTKRVHNMRPMPMTNMKKKKKQLKSVQKQRKRLNFNAYQSEEKEDWLSRENILNVFDVNGELRDAAKVKQLVSISEQHNASRNDWRRLRQSGERNGNWPIESRFYNEESLQYEEKISRINKQYVNGLNNGNGTSFEIIGDLDTQRRVGHIRHPITIKSAANAKVINTEKKKNTKGAKGKNRQTLQAEIEVFLKKELNKNEDTERYRKVRSSILNHMWKDIIETKDAHNKIDHQIFRDYVAKNFGGMFVVFK